MMTSREESCCPLSDVPNHAVLGDTRGDSGGSIGHLTALGKVARRETNTLLGKSCTRIIINKRKTAIDYQKKVHGHF